LGFQGRDGPGEDWIAPMDELVGRSVRSDGNGSAETHF